ncbi:ASCH domain-containing protein [Leuconostoc gasicomitatum]|uniref:ASCH domain-containing protein n=1 Tax=Leuconostoc gasicomitatum TaxID=115778 RepID=UPI001CC4E6BF|nr:ASCH domain-containing protein [Leuconostoc gasicomitatum]MBZ5960132.1 ASCH domain-containing protein [Leuconostoc gasicomitatum]MBZ5970300.1 ASCH domain-containing protein [Leuconostoc gasicomitatum]MBZ5993998.1 ASCH domain-containing protein [Leuconostoc gasicomitatum]MBZ5998095.1 ASCH domain-containing protein [Leuconostoc gasicomitatum]
MNYEQVWTPLLKEFTIFSNSPRSEWQFGAAPSQLVDLVIIGQKTATSSYFPAYAFDKESVPSVGHLNLILDDKLVPKVLTVNTKVMLQSYDQIGDDIAFLEGEGTQDLIYWRQVHEPFFAEVAKEIGQSFIPQDLVVTEYFKVLKIL